MKKNLLKSICLSALMVVLCSQAANAQKTVDMSTELLKDKPAATAVDSCLLYFKAHPQDTLLVKYDEPVVENDTTWIGYRYFMVNGRLQRSHVYQENVVVELPAVHGVDYAEWAALDQKAVETLVPYRLTDGGRNRDVIGYDYGGQWPAIERACNKYGFYLMGMGSFMHVSSRNDFTGSAGVSYLGKRLSVDLWGGPTFTQYTSNSDRAGKKYTALTVELMGYAQPLNIDWADRNKLSFGVGVRADYRFTDSKKINDGVLRSKGSNLTPTFGLKYVHRIFAKGIILGFTIKGIWYTDVYQNDGERFSKLGGEVGVFGGIIIGGNKVVNK